MQSFWKDGPAGLVDIMGSGRDLFTDATGLSHLPGEDESLAVSLDAVKRVTAIDAPSRPGRLSDLMGRRIGAELRTALEGELQVVIGTGSLLDRLLKELPGAAFMSAGAWLRWPGGLAEFDDATQGSSRIRRSVEGVCLTFQPGSAALTANKQINQAISNHPLAPLPFREDDPLAWHPLLPSTGPNQWRIRYTDVWMEDDIIRVSAAFQDSASLPDRGDARVLFHEYQLDAVIDPETHEMRDIDVRAGSLPFQTCLAAPRTAKALVGHHVHSFGDLAPAMLAGTGGCTHLNEVLRTLADVPYLVNMLNSERSGLGA